MSFLKKKLEYLRSPHVTCALYLSPTAIAAVPSGSEYIHQAYPIARVNKVLDNIIGLPQVLALRPERAQEPECDCLNRLGDQITCHWMRFFEVRCADRQVVAWTCLS